MCTDECVCTCVRCGSGWGCCGCRDWIPTVSCCVGGRRNSPPSLPRSPAHTVSSAGMSSHLLTTGLGALSSLSETQRDPLPVSSGKVTPSMHLSPFAAALSKLCLVFRISPSSYYLESHFSFSFSFSVHFDFSPFYNMLLINKQTAKGRCKEQGNTKQYF